MAHRFIYLSFVAAFVVLPSFSADQSRHHSPLQAVAGTRIEKSQKGAIVAGDSDANTSFIVQATVLNASNDLNSSNFIRRELEEHGQEVEAADAASAPPTDFFVGLDGHLQRIDGGKKHGKAHSEALVASEAVHTDVSEASPVQAEETHRRLVSKDAAKGAGGEAQIGPVFDLADGNLTNSLGRDGAIVIPAGLWASTMKAAPAMLSQDSSQLNTSLSAIAWFNVFVVVSIAAFCSLIIYINVNPAFVEPQERIRRRLLQEARHAAAMNAESSEDWEMPGSMTDGEVDDFARDSSDCRPMSPREASQDSEGPAPGMQGPKADVMRIRLGHPFKAIKHTVRKGRPEPERVPSRSSSTSSTKTPEESSEDNRYLIGSKSPFARQARNDSDST